MSTRTQPPGARVLSEETIHEILRNARRRETIDYLRTNDGTVTVSDLAEHVAEYESGESPAPRNVRNSVYVALHQTHLPKLDDHDVVTYNTVGKTVTLADGAEQLEPYLNPVDDDETNFPLSVYYLGVSLALSTVITCAFAGVPGVSLVHPVVWTVGFVLITFWLFAFELARWRDSFDVVGLGQLPVPE